MTHPVDSVELKVRAALLKTTFDRLLPTVCISLVVPVVFAWLLIPRFDPAEIVWWLVALSSVGLLRAALWYAFRRARPHAPSQTARWAFAYWVGSTAAAMAWSLGSLLVFDEASPGEVTLLVITLFGVAAVASGTLSSHLASAVTFLLLTLAPTATVLIVQPDPVLAISGLAMLAGMGILIVTALRLNWEMVRAIRSDLRLVEAVTEAKTARAMAEGANRAKSTFLANVSHEFRTPLNAIIGHGDLLSDDARNRGDAAQVADIDRITQAGRQLLDLITNVLDLAAIESGGVELTLLHADAGAIVRDAVAVSQVLAAAGGNRLIASGTDQLGVVYTDPEKLRQVLLHLVDNACKFTHQGEVTVACERERVEEAEWLVVRIVDSGIGVSPEEVDRAFQAFTQIDESPTRRFGGTGLGLALSRRLCHLMGGTLTATSVLGHGATFTVRIPVGPQAVTAPAP